MGFERPETRLSKLTYRSVPASRNFRVSRAYGRTKLNDKAGFRDRFQSWSVRIAAGSFVLGAISLLGLLSPIDAGWPAWDKLDSVLRVVSMVGFTMTGVGLFVTMARWSRLAELASLDVKAHASMVAEVREMMRADAAILSTIRSLSLDTLYQNDSSLDYVRAMSGRALVHFLARDYRKYIVRLEAIIRDSREKMEFDDERLIGLSVEELEGLLPEGSIWCGVSLLAEEEYRSEILEGFYSRSRAKVQNGTLRMRVLYVVGERAGWVSRERVENDADAGVEVRTTREELQDMSLIWKPKDTVVRANFMEGGADLFDMIDIMYEPVAYLEFGLSMGILRKLAVHPGTSDAFVGAYGKFRTDWGLAQSFAGRNDAAEERAESSRLIPKIE